MPLNKICACIKPPILTFPTESACFSTVCSFQQGGGSCSSTFLSQGLLGAPQEKLTELLKNSTTLCPQITPLKHIQFLDDADNARISKPAAFQEKSMAMHAHTPDLAAFDMSSLVSSIHTSSGSSHFFSKSAS